MKTTNDQENNQILPPGRLICARIPLDHRVLFRGGAIMRLTSGMAAAILAAASATTAEAGSTLPDPVSSCNDVRAYIRADNSMTMDDFKKLLTAAGMDLSGGGSHALDMQCKATAFAKNVILSQHVLTKQDGTEIRVNTRVTQEGGVCRLTEIDLAGC
jgi:hypothetical protein